MRMFKLSALIPQDQLGEVMGFALEQGFEVLECQLLAESSSDKGVGRQPKSRPSKKGLPRPRSRNTERLVLAAISQRAPNPTTIHRKELQRMLPKLTANSIDGALSSLNAIGQIWRVSPGTYTMAKPEQMPEPSFAERNPAENKF